MKYLFLFLTMFSCNQAEITTKDKGSKEFSDGQTFSNKFEKDSFKFLENQSMDQLELSLILVKDLSSRNPDDDYLKTLDESLDLECINGICKISKKEHL